MNNKNKEKVALSPEKRKELISVVITFVAVLGVSAIILSALNIPLGGRIDAAERQSFISVMKRILPAEKYEEADIEFAQASRVYNMHRAYSGDELVGYCVESKADSVDGEMRLAVSADAEGKILSVEIFSRTTTKNSGTKAQDAEFLAQFATKSGEISLAKGTVKDDTQVREVTGMTVSPEVVCDGVNRASVVIGHLKKSEGKGTEQ